MIAGSDKEGQRLYRRPLDCLEPVPLAGTERGSAPFFSWDGEWIGFFADGRLKRIPAAGGAPVDIAAAPGIPGGASWGSDDRIVFAFGETSPLYVVSAEGGTSDTLKGVSNGRHPEVLPDGRTILFESGGWVHAYDRQTGQSQQLVRGTAPRYADGHVIFSRGTTLLAAPMDLTRDKPLGTVFPAADGVAVELPGSGGGRHYTISRSGALAFVPAADAYALVVVDPKGVERLVTAHQRSFENPRFSPDGRYVVVATRIRQDEPTDLWRHDLETNAATRLTFGGGRAPIWTPDGARVTYSRLAEPAGIYTKRADGTSEPELLFPTSVFHWLVGWTPDATTLVYGFIKEGISSIEARSGGPPRIVVEPQSTWGGRLSKDGRWLAYYLLENGTFNVYVRPFAGGHAQWQIGEGTDPAWAPDGNEIYYRSGPRLMAAALDKSSGVHVRSRRVVIDPFLPPLYDDYDIHPKDRSIVLVRPANRTQGREVTMVLNWFSELGRKE